MSFQIVREAAPIYRSPVYVWVKSEYLDAENFSRFGSTQPEYEGASWPLGIPLNRDPRTDADPRVLLIDSDFDYHVKNAWRVPWRRTNLGIATHARRSGANFVVSNIGYWNKEASRYRAIASFLANQKLSDRSATQSFALTPFCLISQHRSEGGSIHVADGRDHIMVEGEIIHSSITLFYTFETFIQECLAWDAHRSGVDAETIVASYEHVYNNTRPADTILTDPAEFRLAQLAIPSVDWDDIVTTARTKRERPTISPGIDIRSWRNILFQIRLQTHLMVAIAAACCGLNAFEKKSTNSPLVQATSSVAAIEQLAPFWLGHVIGTYDHRSACEDVLTNLSRRYGQGALGPADPKMFGARSLSEAERSIEATPQPPLTGRDPPPRVESFRWPLFDVSLDDHSILIWRESIQHMLHP